MSKRVLKDYSFKFAIQIINLYKYLIESKKEFILSKQVLKSGTSKNDKKYYSENKIKKPKSHIPYPISHIS